MWKSFLKFMSYELIPPILGLVSSFNCTKVTNLGYKREDFFKELTIL
jgi:hypothetical protein